MPRTASPDTITAAERMRRFRAGRKQVTLPPQAVADLAAIRARDGDVSDVAAVVRVLREAAERCQQGLSLP